MLLDKGVKFSQEDDYGCTPLHYACLNSNKPLVDVILGLVFQEVHNWCTFYIVISLFHEAMQRIFTGQN